MNDTRSIRWRSHILFDFSDFDFFFFFVFNLNTSVDTLTRDTRPVKNVALSWRRLSMRKTCPIVLPEQNSPKDAISSSQYAVRPAQIARTTSAVSTSSRANALVTDLTNTTNNNNTINANRTAVHFGNDNYNYTEIRSDDGGGGGGGDGDEVDEDDGANNAMPSILNGIGQQCDRIDYDGNNQLPELSSLNSEFLNTILSTPNYQQSSNLSHNSNTSVNCAPMHHETNFVHNNINNGIEQDFNDRTAAAATAAANTSITFDDSRPRQLGRRSEMRSRIVSITAEHIAEGNPVSVVVLSVICSPFFVLSIKRMKETSNIYLHTLDFNV